MLQKEDLQQGQLKVNQMVFYSKGSVRKSIVRTEKFDYKF